MKYIDIHCHLNFAAYDTDREEVIGRANDAGVGMIIVGTTLETSRRAVEIASTRDNIWAIIGLHPIHTNPIKRDSEEFGDNSIQPVMHKGEIFDEIEFKRLASHKKVVGIGECGLDYFYGETVEAREKQRTAFIAQISLANELKKPLMLHIRNGRAGEDAYRDALNILKKEARVIGDAHFFAGTASDAQEFIDMGYYLSFTGVVTFAKQYKELVDTVPMDRIMTETDSPYVAPVPHRGSRNEPCNVLAITEKIASWKGVGVSDMGKIVVENAKRLFDLS